MNSLTIYEGENQLKEEYWRIYKYIQIKLHATEQARGQQKSKWKKKTPRELKMKLKHTKSY